MPCVPVLDCAAQVAAHGCFDQIYSMYIVLPAPLVLTTTLLRRTYGALLLYRTLQLHLLLLTLHGVRLPASHSHPLFFCADLPGRLGYLEHVCLKR